MLIMILQKIFEICVIDTLQTNCCVAEYGFCVEFATCAQCALKSHVKAQCGSRIEFKN